MFYDVCVQILHIGILWWFMKYCNIQFFFRLNAGQIRLLLCLKILFVYTEQEHSANWYVLSGVGVSFGRENMRFYQQNVCWTKKNRVWKYAFEKLSSFFFFILNCFDNINSSSIFEICYSLNYLSFLLKKPLMSQSVYLLFVNDMSVSIRKKY